MLGRRIAVTDHRGNTTAYSYDALGRVTTLTPPQGSNYRTAYAYKKNGSLDYVDVYDAGSSARTSYTYSSTSGKLTQRDFPTVSSQNIRTTYSYDSAGRLEYETITRESGGTTNLYKTQYTYSWIAAASGGGRQMERIEQVYSGGAWTNDNKVTYKYDALEREYFEERHDWALGAWASKFDTTQEYDKNGNRTRYHRNLVLGSTASYGRAEDLSYTYNNVNQLTQVTDADDATYLATVTCDANNNITEITERMGTGTVLNPYNYLFSYFEYDNLNRLLVHKDKRYVVGTNAWVWTKRTHGWDAVGRLEHSNLKTWNDGSQEPAGNSLEHCYAGSRHLQNFDGNSTYSTVWHWAGAANEHGAPLRSPNPDTAAQDGYNLAVAGGAGTPQRRTFLNPTTEGDKRELYAQGRPEAKDSSGGGTNWYLGTQSAPQTGGQNTVESRFFFTGTVASNATIADLSRATDKREKDRLGVFGTSNSYAGSYGRVTSEPIGRDLNPLGRGDGLAYVAGELCLGKISPILPQIDTHVRCSVDCSYNCESGTGNSINNQRAIPTPPLYPAAVKCCLWYTDLFTWDWSMTCQLVPFHPPFPPRLTSITCSYLAYSENTVNVLTLSGSTALECYSKCLLIASAYNAMNNIPGRFYYCVWQGVSVRAWQLVYTCLRSAASSSTWCDSPVCQAACLKYVVTHSGYMGRTSCP